MCFSGVIRLVTGADLEEPGGRNHIRFLLLSLLPGVATVVAFPCGFLEALDLSFTLYFTAQLSNGASTLKSNAGALPSPPNFTSQAGSSSVLYAALGSFPGVFHRLAFAIPPPCRPQTHHAARGILPV
mgnify:CR=1 FL=1